MEIDCPQFLRKLCTRESIRPLSWYVERSPWRFAAIISRKLSPARWGSIAFGGVAQLRNFLNQLATYRRKGERLPGQTRVELDNDLLPAYVGMTTDLSKRMRLRLVTNAGHMEYWLTKESRLIKLPKLAPLSGTSINFRVFEYPERIRVRVAAKAGKQDMTLAAAEDVPLVVEIGG